MGSPGADIPTILILGAALMQRPAYEAAQRRGWRAVAVDRDPHAASRPLAAEFLEADIANHDEVAHVADEYARSRPVHGVFTCGTDFSYTVAVTAARLGLPGMPPEVALRASDKELMRDCFRREGIQSPRYRALPDLTATEIAAAVQELGLPLVVKPVDNMGARGIRLVERQEQIQSAVQIAAAQSRSGRVILEQLIQGPEYSIDALVFDERIVIVGVADRHIFFPPFFVEMGHTIPTILSGTAYRTLVDGFRNAVRALGIEYGAAKGDVFLSNGQAVIGEIAARLSGGYMSGWTFPAAAQFEPVEAAMELALGLRPRNLPLDLDDVQPHKTSAERAWLSIPGKVKEVSGLPTAKHFPRGDVGDARGHSTAPNHGAEAQLVACFPRVSAGSTVSFPTNNVEKCGNIVTCGYLRESAIQLAQDYVRNIRVRLEPAEPTTFDFLFGLSGRDLPWAFRLTHAANLSRLKKMPLYTTSNQSHASGGHTAEPLLSPMATPPRECMYLTLPHPELENDPDYNGTTLHELLELLRIEYNIEPVVDLANTPARAGVVLGAFFWRALLKGGLQGALFIIDTISRDAPSNEELARLTGRLWHDDFLR